MNRICGIYKITNHINGKVYIGSSVNISARWNMHIWSLNTKCIKCNKRLQNAWNKYGQNNFSFKILQECDEELLLINETYWIKFYNSNEPNNGYNIEMPLEKTKSLETRKKLSILKSGKNHHFYGKHLNQNTKDKISKANKGNIPLNKILSFELIKLICEDKDKGMKIKQLIEKYNISKNSIYRALQTM